MPWWKLWKPPGIFGGRFIWAICFLPHFAISFTDSESATGSRLARCDWFVAGIHRMLRMPFSKVRSLRMDVKVWTPTLKKVQRICRERRTHGADKICLGTACVNQWLSPILSVLCWIYWLGASINCIGCSVAMEGCKLVGHQISCSFLQIWFLSGNTGKQSSTNFFTPWCFRCFWRLVTTTPVSSGSGIPVRRTK